MKGDYLEKHVRAERVESVTLRKATMVRDVRGESWMNWNPGTSESIIDKLLRILFG